MKNFVTAHKEAFKNILLIVLFLAMLFQTIYTWTYGLDLDSVPENSFSASFVKLLGYNKDGLRAKTESAPAAYPLKAMVNGKNGLYGVQYNENGVGAVYEKSKLLWKSALDKAEKLKPSSEDNLKYALGRPFVFVKYDGLIPLNIISGWFGSDFYESDNTSFVDSLLLSQISENDYYMYIRDSKTGDILELKTKISDEEFFKVTDGFAANECRIAMNLGEEYSVYLPETMIFNTNMSFDILNSADPSFVAIQDKSEGKDSVRRLLEAFNYNPYTSKKYQEDNGNIQNFIENFRTLRVEKNGRVKFEASDIRGGIEAYQRGKLAGRDAEMQCIELSQTITKNAISSMAGNSQASNCHVALVKWYNIPKTNTNVAVFSLRYNGIPIDSTENSFFARFEFRGNMMIRAVLNMRQYTKSENSNQLYILPERQLTALAEAQNSVGICIRYQDMGERSCTANWKMYSVKQ